MGVSIPFSRVYALFRDYPLARKDAQRKDEEIGRADFASLSLFVRYGSETSGRMVVMGVAKKS